LAILTLAAACGAGCDAFAYLLVKTVGPFVPENEHKAEDDLTGRSGVRLVDLKDPLVASEFPRLGMSLGDEIGTFLADQEACGRLSRSTASRPRGGRSAASGNGRWHRSASTSTPTW